MKPAAGVVLLLAAGAAQAGVFRCAEPDGRVTYQDTACAGTAVTQATHIPTEFPPPNVAERESILKREAELEQRLEARRERESREAMLRIASTPPPPPEPQYADVYPVYYPVLGPRPTPRHGPWGSHRPMRGAHPTPFRP